MTERNNITLKDIRTALDCIKSTQPECPACNCLKSGSHTGCCVEHGLIVLSRKEHEHIKNYFGVDEK